MDSLNPTYNPFKEERKKGSTFTQEQLDYLYELIQLGWSVSRICSTYNLDKKSIKKRIQNNDWLSHKLDRNVCLTNKELDEMHDMYLSGVSVSDIAEYFKVSEENVHRRVINNTWKKTGKKLQYTFNENYFDIIDTEHKAYWLGFLTADGYILSKRERKGKGNEQQSFGFAISMNDSEILENFKKDLEATHPIKVYKNMSGFTNNGSYGRILLTSQHTVDSLKKWGVVENKTFFTKMPDIDNNLIPAFIRGYSDGDGSIIINKNGKFQWNLTGTKELLEGIKEFFHKENLKLNKRWKNEYNNYTLVIFGNQQVPKLLDIIYKDATIYLKRKYNKYAEMRGING